jgi:N-acetylglucosamine-6-sulfatase
MPVDGRSLLPLLHDPAAAWRDALVLEAWSEAEGKQFVALRTAADRKFVDLGDEQELYDLAADPHELENLGRKPEHAAERARLTAHLHALRSTAPGQEPPRLP